MNKKIVVALSALCLFFVSCASNKTKGKNKEESPKNTEAVSPAQENPPLQKKDEENSKNNVKTGKPGSEIEKKNYIGWIDTSKRNLDVSFGNIRIKTKNNLGTFNLLINNRDKKSIPVLSTSNEYTTSFFALKAGKRIYKLEAAPNIDFFARRSDAGIQMGYSIKNVADVYIFFDCLKSSPDEDYDLLKITATIINTSKRKTDFALKCVLDTVIGETMPVHYYTSKDVPLKSEVVYRTMKNERWLLTKNLTESVQFLLDGADITTPETVAVGSETAIASKNWEPSVNSSRSFGTVLSYNDSAIGITWPKTDVAVDNSKSEIFYMAFATAGRYPNGEKFIKVDDKKDEKKSKNLKKTKKEKEEKIKVFEENLPEIDEHEDLEEEDEEIEEVKEKTVKKEPKKAEKKVTKPKKEEKLVEFTEIDSSEEDDEQDVSKNVPKSHLNTEYIKSLLNKIESLEADGSNVNKAELDRLNDELDVILNLLRN